MAELYSISISPAPSSIGSSSIIQSTLSSILFKITIDHSLADTSDLDSSDQFGLTLESTVLNNSAFYGEDGIKNNYVSSSVTDTGTTWIKYVLIPVMENGVDITFTPYVVTSKVVDATDVLGDASTITVKTSDYCSSVNEVKDFKVDDIVIDNVEDANDISAHITWTHDYSNEDRSIFDRVIGYRIYCDEDWLGELTFPKTVDADTREYDYSLPGYCIRNHMKEVYESTNKTTETIKFSIVVLKANIFDPDKKTYYATITYDRATEITDMYIVAQNYQSKEDIKYRNDMTFTMLGSNGDKFWDDAGDEINELTLKFQVTGNMERYKVITYTYYGSLAAKLDIFKVGRSREDEFADQEENETGIYGYVYPTEANRSAFEYNSTTRKSYDENNMDYQNSKGEGCVSLPGDNVTRYVAFEVTVYNKAGQSHTKRSQVIKIERRPIIRNYYIKDDQVGSQLYNYEPGFNIELYPTDDGVTDLSNAELYWGIDRVTLCEWLGLNVDRTDKSFKELLNAYCKNFWRNILETYERTKNIISPVWFELHLVVKSDCGIKYDASSADKFSLVVKDAIEKSYEGTDYKTYLTYYTFDIGEYNKDFLDWLLSADHQHHVSIDKDKFMFFNGSNDNTFKSIVKSVVIRTDESNDAVPTDEDIATAYSSGLLKKLFRQIVDLGYMTFRLIQYEVCPSIYTQTYPVHWECPKCGYEFVAAKVDTTGTLYVYDGNHESSYYKKVKAIDADDNVSGTFNMLRAARKNFSCPGGCGYKPNDFEIDVIPEFIQKITGLDIGIPRLLGHMTWTVDSWESNTRYEIGDYVHIPTINNKIFRCIEAHTSESTPTLSMWEVCKLADNELYNGAKLSYLDLYDYNNRIDKIIMGLFYKGKDVTGKVRQLLAQIFASGSSISTSTILNKFDILSDDCASNPGYSSFRELFGDASSYIGEYRDYYRASCSKCGHTLYLDVLYRDGQKFHCPYCGAEAIKSRIEQDGVSALFDGSTLINAWSSSSSAVEDTDFFNFYHKLGYLDLDIMSHYCPSGEIELIEPSAVSEERLLKINELKSKLYNVAWTYKKNHGTITGFTVTIGFKSVNSSDPTAITEWYSEISRSDTETLTYSDSTLFPSTNRIVFDISTSGSHSSTYVSDVVTSNTNDASTISLNINLSDLADVISTYIASNPGATVDIYTEVRAYYDYTISQGNTQRVYGKSRKYNKNDSSNFNYYYTDYGKINEVLAYNKFMTAKADNIGDPEITMLYPDPQSTNIYNVTPEIDNLFDPENNVNPYAGNYHWYGDKNPVMIAKASVKKESGDPSFQLTRLKLFDRERGSFDDIAADGNLVYNGNGLKTIKDGYGTVGSSIYNEDFQDAQWNSEDYTTGGDGWSINNTSAINYDFFEVGSGKYKLCFNEFDYTYGETTGTVVAGDKIYGSNFSESQSYEAGDVVIYPADSDTYYVSNTDVPAGAWDASKWDASNSSAYSRKATITLTAGSTNTVFIIKYYGDYSGGYVTPVNRIYKDGVLINTHNISSWQEFDLTTINLINSEIKTCSYISLPVKVNLRMTGKVSFTVTDSLGNVLGTTSVQNGIGISKVTEDDTTGCYISTSSSNIEDFAVNTYYYNGDFVYYKGISSDGHSLSTSYDTVYRCITNSTSIRNTLPVSSVYTDNQYNYYVNSKDWELYTKDYIEIKKSESISYSKIISTTIPIRDFNQVKTDKFVYLTISSESGLEYNDSSKNFQTANDSSANVMYTTKITIAPSSVTKVTNPEDSYIAMYSNYNKREYIPFPIVSYNSNASKYVFKQNTGKRYSEMYSEINGNYCKFKLYNSDIYTGIQIYKQVTVSGSTTLVPIVKEWKFGQDSNGNKILYFNKEDKYVPKYEAIRFKYPLSPISSFSESTEYNYGDYVVYNDLVYQYVSNTGSGSWVSTKWKHISYYSSTKTYSVGSYVARRISNESPTVYKCTTAVTSAEEWDGSKWSPVYKDKFDTSTIRVLITIFEIIIMVRGFSGFVSYIRNNGWFVDFDDTSYYNTLIYKDAERCIYDSDNLVQTESELEIGNHKAYMNTSSGTKFYWDTAQVAEYKITTEKIDPVYVSDDYHVSTDDAKLFNAFTTYNKDDIVRFCPSIYNYYSKEKKNLYSDMYLYKCKANNTIGIAPDDTSKWTKVSDTPYVASHDADWIIAVNASFDMNTEESLYYGYDDMYGYIRIPDSYINASGDIEFPASRTALDDYLDVRLFNLNDENTNLRIEFSNNTADNIYIPIGTAILNNSIGQTYNTRTETPDYNYGWMLSSWEEVNYITNAGSHVLSDEGESTPINLNKLVDLSNFSGNNEKLTNEHVYNGLRYGVYRNSPEINWSLKGTYPTWSSSATYPDNTIVTKDSKLYKVTSGSLTEFDAGKLSAWDSDYTVCNITFTNWSYASSDYGVMTTYREYFDGSYKKKKLYYLNASNTNSGIACYNSISKNISTYRKKLSYQYMRLDSLKIGDSYTNITDGLNHVINNPGDTVSYKNYSEDSNLMFDIYYYEDYDKQTVLVQYKQPVYIGEMVRHYSDGSEVGGAGSSPRNYQLTLNFKIINYDNNNRVTLVKDSIHYAPDFSTYNKSPQYGTFENMIKDTNTKWYTDIEYAISRPTYKYEFEYWIIIRNKDNANSTYTQNHTYSYSQPESYTITAGSQTFDNNLTGVNIMDNGVVIIHDTYSISKYNFTCKKCGYTTTSFVRACELCDGDIECTENEEFKSFVNNGFKNISVKLDGINLPMNSSTDKFEIRFVPRIKSYSADRREAVSARIDYKTTYKYAFDNTGSVSQSGIIGDPILSTTRSSLWWQLMSIATTPVLPVESYTGTPKYKLAKELSNYNKTHTSTESDDGRIEIILKYFTRYCSGTTYCTPFGLFTTYDRPNGYGYDYRIGRGRVLLQDIQFISTDACANNEDLINKNNVAKTWYNEYIYSYDNPGSAITYGYNGAHYYPTLPDPDTYDYLFTISDKDGNYIDVTPGGAHEGERITDNGTTGPVITDTTPVYINMRFNPSKFTSVDKISSRLGCNYKIASSGTTFPDHKYACDDCGLTYDTRPSECERCGGTTFTEVDNRDRYSDHFHIRFYEKEENDTSANKTINSDIKDLYYNSSSDYFGMYCPHCGRAYRIHNDSSIDQYDYFYDKDYEVSMLVDEEDNTIKYIKDDIINRDTVEAITQDKTELISGDIADKFSYKKDVYPESVIIKCHDCGDTLLPVTSEFINNNALAGTYWVTRATEAFNGFYGNHIPVFNKMNRGRYIDASMVIPLYNMTYNTVTKVKNIIDKSDTAPDRMKYVTTIAKDATISNSEFQEETITSSDSISAYNASTTYYLNDFCTQNNKIYKCVVASSTGQGPTSSDFKECEDTVISGILDGTISQFIDPT